MNFIRNSQLDGLASKENALPSNKENVLLLNKMDVSRMQRAKQRTVLGVLTENEQHSRSLSQGSQLSKESSITDSSQPFFFGCPSSSSFDVFVDDACEVVLAASGDRMASDTDFLDEDDAALQHKDFRLFLEMSSCSCPDTSMHSEPDDTLPLEDGVLPLSEYAEDIHQHLREREVKIRPNAGYMEKHPEITNCMRVVLVDWLVEVTQEFKFHYETLYLAINYMDRFLSCTASVKRSKLQLVGTAAILLAAKYEEIFPPDLDEFVYITDNTYTKKQLVHMEHIFLRVLAFNMAAPTTYQFLSHYMSIQSVCSKTENLALYVAELSLLEIKPFLQYTPSTVAAAAYCLANYTINKALWPDSLHSFTSYTMADIVPCLNDLHKLYFTAECRPQQAIREKYMSSKYHSVSKITPPAVLPCS
ncbi:cyclin-A1 [Myripristis murdjan]|uniref:G2/mitotic-specific cyclin-B2 n=1 Tax=Myripristis murdjan TaxID=586833 RepID=A0A667YG01_9TELE|nr:cyclin-A1 [Myripristis murdjan]